MKQCILPILVATPLAAQAATLSFGGPLSGAQEVPANASPGTGSVLLVVDTATRAWTLTGGFDGLIGNSNNAHIHGPAAVGVNAGVVVGLAFTSGTTSGSISGAGTFTVPQDDALLSELYYVNLHSTSFPGGELRGQLMLIPEPATATLGLLGFAGWCARRRRR